jgi:sortase (surface protein transpeptidase)
VQLTVPAMGLDESLIDLGIAGDGSMEVPQDFSRVGWFTGGGRPGGIGPTVIAGHVDSAVGPAVFYELGLLVPGDRFTVTDAAGTPFEYEVYRAEDFAKDAFPTAEVFGALLADEVRLITCTGLFDESIGHYEDNRVVFAGRVA